MTNKSLRHMLGLMRTLRLMIAALVATSLVVLPVSAGLAKTHAAKAEMTIGASGDSCPCCDATHKCTTEICTSMCYSTLAISVQEQQVVEPLPKVFVGIGSASMSPFSQRPDPPPPRS